MAIPQDMGLAGALRETCSLSSSVHNGVETVPCQPYTNQGTGQDTDLVPAAKVRAAAAVTGSSPVNAGLLYCIWHNFSWLQHAACEYLLDLSQGHAPIHPDYDRSGGEAAMASWPVTHID